jgi:uncharacterized repeat protein (TIGR02543 family)
VAASCLVATAHATVRSVTSLSDSASSPAAGTLRYTINNAADGDVISFDPSLFNGGAQTLTLNNAQLEITKSITLAGPGADKLTISGNSASRIFLINDADTSANKTVTITGLKLTGGTGQGETLATGVPGSTSGGGGAIYCTENLTLRSCAIVSNTAGASPGGGGAHFISTGVTPTITLDGCTFSANAVSVTGTNGGAFSTNGVTLSMTNCTLSANQTLSSGGGAYLSGTTRATFTNCTIVSNLNLGSALNGGAGIRLGSAGTSLALKNSIVAGNSQGLDANSLTAYDIRNAGTLTGNNNVIGDPTNSGGLSNGTNGNIVGNSGSVRTLSTIINTTLANNGGPTQTHLLATGSVALNAGSNASASALATDQRGIGYNRFSGTVDAGAVEGTSATAAFTTNGVAPLGLPSQVNNSSTLSFIVPAGSNRLLVVTASASSTAGASDITGVTYNGTAMTLAVKQSDGAAAVDSLWQVALGTSSSATSVALAVSTSGTGATVTSLGAIAFQNVNQTTPIGNTQKVSAPSSGSPTLPAVTSAAGDLVLDLLDIYDSSDVGTQTPGTAQAVVHNVDAPSSSLHGFYQTSLKAGASSVTPSWTSSGTAAIQIAADIKLASPAQLVLLDGGTSSATQLTRTYSGWAATTTTNAAADRFNHTAVWTGATGNSATANKMIVWGGDDGRGEINTGGRYDPATDTWTATTTTGAPSARGNHVAVWTGATGNSATANRMIVWSGFASTAVTNTGSIYDPATDSWSAMSTTNAPAARYYATAVWTGATGSTATANKMLVWGGADDAFNGHNSGGIYDPATNSWTAMNATNAPTGRVMHSAVWTGNTGNVLTSYKMIVFGGEGPPSVNTVSDGGIYDPATNTWTTLAASTTAGSRAAHAAVWTGSEMIVYGGHTGSSLAATSGGARYNPATGVWTALPTTAAPGLRDYPISAWTGEALIVFGGYDASYNRLATGALYSPTADAWTALTTTGSPAGRSQAVGVWSGTQFLVFGGAVTGTTKSNTGSVLTAPTNLTFSASGSRTFDIANLGGSDLNSVAVSFSGTNASDFSITSAPATTIAGGSDSPFTVTFTPGSTGTRTATMTITSNNPARPSYAVNLSGTGVTTYSVAYNGNGSTGGTAPTDSSTYASGASVTVRANTGSLVRTGYTFGGWNTAANGSGTSYAATGSATFTMPPASVTLYAQWTVADSTPPTITSIARLTPAAQTSSDGTASFVFRATYSEAVLGVTPAQFTVEAVNGSSITGTVASVSGSGSTRDVTVTITGGNGEFRLKPVN